MQMGVVGRLVFREAEVPIDTEDFRGIGNAGQGFEVGSHCSAKGFGRDLYTAIVRRFVGIEPFAVVVFLQVPQEPDGLFGKFGEHRICH